MARVAHPATAAPKGFLLYCIANAENIGAGRCAPEELGVIAVDDFTFQVNLRGPTAFFLRLTSNPALLATPRHTIRIHKDAWTDPAHIVSGGAFLLSQHIAYDKILLTPNPNDDEAKLVKLKRLTFIPVAAGSTAVNLYKAAPQTRCRGSTPARDFSAARQEKGFSF